MKKESLSSSNVSPLFTWAIMLRQISRSQCYIYVLISFHTPMKGCHKFSFFFSGGCMCPDQTCVCYPFHTMLPIPKRRIGTCCTGRTTSAPPCYATGYFSVNLPRCDNIFKFTSSYNYDKLDNSYMLAAG